MENVCKGKLGVTHGEEKWLILRSGEIKETERKKVWNEPSSKIVNGKMKVLASMMIIMALNVIYFSQYRFNSYCDFVKTKPFYNQFNCFVIIFVRKSNYEKNY